MFLGAMYLKSLTANGGLAMAQDAFDCVLDLARHAESTLNQDGLYIGGGDPEIPLSEEGERQNAVLAAYLASCSYRPDEIWTSPMLRARRLAEATCQALRRDLTSVISDPRLREIHKGRWENLRKDKTYTPAIKERMANMGMYFRPPGGESMDEAAERMLEWLKDCVLSEGRGKRGQKFFVCTHGGPIQSLLQRLFHLDHRLAWRIQINNASITRLHYTKENGWSLVFLNHVPARTL